MIEDEMRLREDLIDHLYELYDQDSPIELPRLIYQLCTNYSYYPGWFASFCAVYCQETYAAGIDDAISVIRKGLQHCEGRDSEEIRLKELLEELSSWSRNI